MIRKWAQSSGTPEVTSYPTGICEYCRRLLFLCEKEGSTNLQGQPGATQRWDEFHLKNISVPRGQLAAPAPSARPGRALLETKGALEA